MSGADAAAFGLGLFEPYRRRRRTRHPTPTALTLRLTRTWKSPSNSPPVTCICAVTRAGRDAADTEVATAGDVMRQRRGLSHPDIIDAPRRRQRCTGTWRF